jgi:hypothetical protein
VYWYILRKRQDCGVREVQRVLGFSSSSTAHYHLEKLVDKGILIRDSYGNYKVNDRVRVKMISPFIIVHGFAFPKQVFYAVATTLMCVFFTLFFLEISHFSSHHRVVSWNVGLRNLLV